ncbi:MAG: ATPase family protein [uncultured Sulfurovum sp.]|uniref:ATPase family protein n=1 Tax=uncultured Sulfurovum sp. TaxID=269237 RepID=A0A6S6SFJ6_9BACT|nr:MAG: ATPase family protein [uncultured Sulfurovum sp.]
MNSGTVVASIETIVNDLKPVTWRQVLYEAVTNALQANATEIKINFIQNSLDLEDTPKYIDSVMVEDNGDGFNEKNTKSFREYRSTYKKYLGCKGIGRFLFLKVFDKVKIESFDKSIEFVINNDIEVSKTSKEFKRTTLKFLNPKDSFTVEYQTFKDDLKNYFLAYFKLLKDENRLIKISICENEKVYSIVESDDIPDFKDKDFMIGEHEFKLSYILDFNADGYYCAGNRVVIKNSELESNKKFRFFKDVNILYLLSSPYLDSSANDTRDDFNIYPKKKQQDLLHNLSWQEIQNGVKEQIKIIAKDNNIEIDKLAEEHLKEAIKESPFLVYYLRKNELGEDSKGLQKQAKKLFEKDKQFLRDNKNETHEKYKEKLAIVTQSELTEYIYDRQKKIDLLKKLTDEKALEKEIHNLFMQQGTSDKKEDYRTNNLWLFDDRFMTYDKIFSEAQIKDIFPNLIANTKRPDILSLSIVSNSYNQEEITDIVIIELKRPNEDIDPSGAETQLLRYSRYINESRANNKIRIWTYAFLKFNEETEFDLDNRSYNKIPIQGEYPIYYKYYEKPNTIINFLDYRAMAIDANNRNKTFMKILGGIGVFK